MTDVFEREGPVVMPLALPVPDRRNLEEPRATRRRLGLIGMALVAVIGVALAGIGFAAFDRASETNDLVAAVNKEISAAQEARDRATEESEAARVKANDVDKQKQDLEGRLKRLSAVTQDVVRSSNGLIEQCLTPWTGNRTSREQVLQCLPDRIREYQAAVDAETQAISDIRSTLATIEGALNV